MTELQLMLAATDWMTGLNLVVNVLLTIAVAYVGMKARKIERLEGELKEQARQLVKAEIAMQTGELARSIDVLSERVRSILERLAKGDSAFDRLGEGKHSLEIKLMTRIGECATKEDMRLLTERMEAMQVELAKVVARGHVAVG